MRHPTVIVLESDGRLARHLEPLAAERRWVLREPRHDDGIRRLLTEAEQAVFVVRLSRRPERELALLAEVPRLYPAVRTVAVGDTEEAAVLAGLAWDLAVDFALFPPLSRELLPDIVAGLMR